MPETVQCTTSSRRKTTSLKLTSETYYISPHWQMVTGILGLLFGPVGIFSILRSTSKPSMTRPEILQKSVHKAERLAITKCNSKRKSPTNCN